MSIRSTGDASGRGCVRCGPCGSGAARRVRWQRRRARRAGRFRGSRDAAPVGPIRRIHSTDAWVRAAARLAAAPLAPQGEVAGEGDFGAAGDLIATASLHDADLPDLESFEARHLAPALAALQAGRLERVTLLSADRRVTLAASDRYRVWRPRRPWLTALGEQG